MKIIILAGGGGTRLFPLSRKSMPKQFLSIDKEMSLLGETVLRFKAIVAPEDIVIVTNVAYASHVQQELDEIDCPNAHIVTEPAARNTAPAIALAARYCQDKLGCDSSEVLFISTSDHIIRPMLSFQKTVLRSKKHAEAGHIVTFGIKPTKPETGFGYIETSDDNESVFKTLSFKEKPDLHTAKEYLAKGNYFWNSGMFSFTIGTYLSELEKYAPKISKLLKPGYDEIFDNFSAMPDISIDYAVAEKSEVGVTIPLNLNWNDVGSWDAIYEIMEKDENNNAVKGDVIAIDSRENLFFGKNRLIAGIGVRNLMVVDTDDVVVVCHRGDSQKVKDLVGILKADDRREPFEIVKKLVE